MEIEGEGAAGADPLHVPLLGASGAAKSALLPHVGTHGMLTGGPGTTVAGAQETELLTPDVAANSLIDVLNTCRGQLGGSTAREIEQAQPVPDAEHERRLRDAELVVHLASSDFAGSEYDLLESRLARYGFQVIGAWTRSRYIFLKCLEKRIKGIFPPGNEERWSDEDVEELVQDTVAHALVVFQRDALRGGKWRPDGGASLTTYFIGACLIAFAGVYRSHRRRWRQRAASDATAQAERPFDVPDVADAIVARESVAVFLSKPNLRRMIIIGS